MWLFFASAFAGEPPTSSPIPSTTIVVNGDKPLFTLSELMIGANMEDLHYQMVGGLDSQLLHGESFFEPSPTALAKISGWVEGFTSVEGAWRVVDNGILRVDPNGGSMENGGEVPTAAGVSAGDMKLGARLISNASAPDGAVETKCEIWFPPDAQGSAALIFRVHPNQSDNKWEWYSGYTLNLCPAQKELILTRASRAAHHLAFAKATAEIKTGDWNSVVVRVANGEISVRLNDKSVLVQQDSHLLTGNLFGLVAHENVMFRNLGFMNQSGAVSGIPFQTGGLIRQAGDEISLRWAKVQTGDAQGAFALLQPGQGTWFPNGQSQRIVFQSGKGEIGIDNAGLKRQGISLKAGKNYEGYLRVKTTSPVAFKVSLRNASGQTIYAEKILNTAGAGDFERLSFSLTPFSSDPNGRFAITLIQPGEITVGYAFLEPGDWGRYKGLHVRKDLAEALLAQGIHVLRFNGGMIEVPGYRWKNMKALRDERAPYDGFYDRYCSSGFGPAEIVAFGQAAGLPIIPALNLAETPEDVTDFIKTCQPRFYQVANESRFNEAYVKKFEEVAEAVWKVAPDIALITTSTHVDVKDTSTEAEARTALALHLELASFAQKHQKSIMFDSHSFGGASTVKATASFARWLQRLAPDPKLVSVGVLELNAGAFDFQRGLNHALEMNEAERDGDVIRAVGMPNVSQPWKVYQTDWKAVLWTQGNIYYTQDEVWFQAAYYVDQMISQSWAPLVVSCRVEAAPHSLDALAAKTADGKGLVLRVVNSNSRPITAGWNLTGFDLKNAEATVLTLAGDPSASNTLEQPEQIKPVQTNWSHHMKPEAYTFPGNSFTVIVFQ